ncbi:hypothetical protein B0H11DRAFT_1910769 [Mycena galericulata]|nr:hypothetical protein B0H11DRAFT_1910769 [Mycena galericulata]
MLILTLLLQMLVAVSIFAAPSPGMRGPTHISRHEEFIEQATSEPGAFHSLNWAGAVISDPVDSVALKLLARRSGTLYRVYLPCPPSSIRSPSMAILVVHVVDHASIIYPPPLCNTATVKSGLDIEIKNGVTSYFDWQAGNTYTDVGNFSAGDEIELTVEAIGRLETWATDVTKIWSGVKGPWFIR